MSTSRMHVSIRDLATVISSGLDDLILTDVELHVISKVHTMTSDKVSKLGAKYINGKALIVTSSTIILPELICNN